MDNANGNGVTRVPASLEELTPDWLSYVLGYTINPSSFKITPNVHDGKGFLSNLLRISCQKQETMEKIDVIVKLIPENEAMKHILISQNLDKMEILTYQNILPKFMQAVPSLADYICPFFYGKFEGSGDSYRSVLVLEDLKPKGYTTLDYGENVTQSQYDEGIDFLAKLHFAGAVIEKKEGKPLNKIYDFLQLDLKEQAVFFQDLLRQSYPLVTQLLSTSSQEVQKAYMEMDPFLENLIVDVFVNTAQFPSLIHGDLWTNNILFTSDPTLHTKVIDWQQVGYKDPVLDLALYITLSLPTNMITNEYIQKSLKQYYDLYEKLCIEKKLPELLQRRDWKDFSTQFNTYGLTYALLIFSIWMVAIGGKDDQRLLKTFEYFQEVGVVEFATNVKNLKK